MLERARSFPQIRLEGAIPFRGRIQTLRRSPESCALLDGCSQLHILSERYSPGVYSYRNRFMIDGETEDVMPLEPFADKWRAFGWHVIRVDGHDHEALHRAYEEARGAMGGGKPIMVIADTVKGKGVSFMEHSVLWHYRTARGEEYEAALKELEAGKP